jgi:putative hydrolase of the HAD superfamily
MIFFDIDETLINQQRAEALAAERFLAVYREQLDRAYSVPEFCYLWRSLREKHARSSFVGVASYPEQRRRRIRELFGARAGNLSDAAADARFDFYQEHYANGWTLFEDVLPCLQSLAGHTIGIISNGRAEQQRRKLRYTGIEQYFDVVVISEEVGAAKPHREIFLAACRKAGFTADECVYVGDRLDLDAEASRAAGINGFWLDRKRSAANVDIAVIRSLAELRAKVPGIQ